MAKIHGTLRFGFLLLTLLSSIAWAQLPVADDSYVSSAAPTTNNGNNPSLVVQKSSNGTALIKLDLSALQAAGVTSGAIDKAYLKLYTSAVTGQGTFDLYQVTSSWAEGSVTYNTIPSMMLVNAGTTCPSGVQCVNTASKYVQVDITSLLQAWLTTPSSNFGLALKPNATTISVTFESKESTTTSHAPELDVVYNTSLAQIPGQIGPAQVGPGIYNINISGSAATLAMTSQCLGGAYATGISLSGTAQCATNGSAFTNLMPGNISSGIAGISITGNANTATTAGFATNAGTAAIAGSATNFTGSLMGDVTGTQGATVVSKIGGIAASNFARLDIGNAFTSGKQTLALSSAAFASLNIPVNGASPTVPAKGDIWLSTDPHLNFRTMNNSTEMLAFFSDVTTANAGTLASAKAYTDGQITTEAAARVAGDASTLSAANAHADAGDLSTLSSANAHADAGDTATLSSANTFTSSAVGAEAVLRAAGDAATLTSANNYTDAEKARAMAAEALKANLAGGNVFTAGSQVLAPSDTGFSSLKIPNGIAAPSSPQPGDVWLLSGDRHLQFQTMTGLESLAFTSEVSAATGAVTAETARAMAAEGVLTTSLNNEVSRAQGAEATLSSSISGEATRAQGAEASLNTAIGAVSTDLAAEVMRATGAEMTLTTNLAAEVTRAITAESTKANLSGGNTFAGDQIVNGNTTLKGSLILPAITSGSGAAPSQLFQLAGSDASNQPTLFEWLVTSGGVLDLRTATGGNPTQDSGLMIGSDGKITFASGRIFPGVQSTLIAGTGIDITGNVVGNTGVLSVSGDGTSITNGGTAQNRTVSVGTISESQVSGLSSDLATLTNSVSAETTRAQGVEAGLATSIEGESSRAQGVEATLAGTIATETSRATAAETTLTNTKANLAGGNAFTGTQTLGPLSNAASQASNLFRLNATDGSNISQTAQLQALVDGSLSFQFGLTAGPISSKLTIDPTGIITFAAGQTFPGTNNGTVTQINTGAGLTGGPITSTGTISIPNGGVTNAMLQNSSIGVVAGTGIGVTGTSSLGGSFTIANTGVLSFNGRNGLVLPQANDYSFGQLSGTDSPTSHLIYNNQANIFGAGQKQTFTASATVAGLSLDGGVANDPTTLASGDTWFNTTANHLKFFDGTTTKTLAFTTDIAAGTVTGAGLTTGQLIVGAGGSAIATGNLTGEVTTNNSTAASLAATISTAHTFNSAGNSFTGNGAGLTNVNAAALGGLSSSAFAQLGTNNVFTGSVTASSVSGNGANLTALNATNISTGTLADARLSANVPLLNAANNFTNTTGNNFAGTTILGSTAAASGGLLIPANHNGSSRPSFPFDMEATNTGSATHLFRIIAQDGGTPNWDFQFCVSTPCTPADSGLSIAGASGIITFAPGQTFPGTGTGTVTSVATGAGLTGGPITSTGTISIATAGVTNAMLQNSSVTVNSAGGLTGGGALSLGGTLSLSTNGTSTNTANTLVSRDASGNFSAGTITASLNGNAATATTAGSAGTATTAATATTAGNVTGIVAVANGGTGVNSTNTAANRIFASPSGATGAPTFRAITAADLPTPQNTRAICYVAGSDGNTSALDTTFSQKSFFNNLIGAMTITSATCQVDAGSVTMNVQKNNLASAITTNVGCTSTPGTWQALTVSGSSLALGDSLDLSITGVPTAKRLTVCVAGTVN